MIIQHWIWLRAERLARIGKVRIEEPKKNKINE
jgi:hypothetical protein